MEVGTNYKFIILLLITQITVHCLEKKKKIIICSVKNLEKKNETRNKKNGNRLIGLYEFRESSDLFGFVIKMILENF